MSKVLRLVTLLLVIASLVACAQPAPTPTPKPLPTKAAPTAVPPTPVPPTAVPAAQPLAKPAGTVLFTITGDIKLTNADKAVQVDAANVAKLVKEYTMDDPWAGAGQKYAGVLLSDLWKAAGGSDAATGATLTATDGMRVRVAREDLMKWPILVVLQASGKDLAKEQGGPAKLAFPPEAGQKYSKDLWLWYIKTIDIGVLPSPIAKPAGPVYFTVTGNIDLPNVDKGCQIDAANIAKFVKEYTIDDPWVGKGQKYSGILLSDLFTICGGTEQATAALLTATDGMKVTVLKEDLQKWPILIATQAGGKELTKEQGGPAKLAFPPEAGEKYAKELWMWNIKTIEFGKPPKPLAKPTGTVLFTITGMVDLPNVDKGCQIDAGNINKYVKEHTIDDPVAGKGQKYTGVLLSELWKRAGANYQATGAIVRTADGQKVSIAKADAEALTIVVVTQLNGKDLTAAQGAPARLAFVGEAAQKYPAEAWVTGIKTIEFAKLPKPLAKPTGPVLFTVTGKIDLPNAASDCQIDAGNISKYLKEATLDDPVAGKGQKYTGILLSEVWKRAGALDNAAQAIVTAADGKKVTVAKDDLTKWGILIVTQVGGKDLTAEQGGPAKLAFPPEAAAKYANDAWLTAIKTIEIK